MKRRVSTLWSRYIGEVRTNFAKAYGMKVRCYWELFALTHVQEKQKKLAGKVMSIVQVESEQWTVHTDLGKKKPLLPSPTRKEGRPLHFTMWLLIGYIEILFLNLAATIFGLD